MMLPLRAFAAASMVLLIGPLVVAIGSAFGQTNYLAFPPQGFTLRWFLGALNDPGYGGAFLTSIEVAGLVTAASLLLGIPAAYAVARLQFRGRGFVEAVLLLPLILPTIALSIGLSSFFSHIGFPRGLLRLVAAHLVVCAPYVVRVILPLIRGADPVLEEAARNLGAGPVTAFLLVTLPIVRSGIAAAAVLSFIVSFDEFELALFLAPPRAPTLPVLLFARIEYGPTASVGAVAGILVMLASLTMVAFGFIFLRRRTR